MTRSREAVLKIRRKAKCGRTRAVYIFWYSRKNALEPEVCIKHRIWELTRRQRRELPVLIGKWEDLLREREEWVVRLLCGRTGQPEDQIRGKLKAAERRGIRSWTFIFRGLYDKPELKDKARKKTKKRPESDPKGKEVGRNTPSMPAGGMDDNDGVVDIPRDFGAVIMERTGWTEGRFKYELLKAKCVNGCSDRDYYLNRMYEKSEEEYKNYFTMELKIRLWCRYAGSKAGVDLFRLKEQFNVRFADFLGRQTFRFDEMTFEGFLREIKGLHTIVFKPARSNKGRGFLKLSVNESLEQNMAVYETLKSANGGIVEECIEQHPDIAAFYPDAVNTIRILTSVKDGVPHLLCGVMRIAVSGNVDNWSKGGLSAGIDLETGRLCTNGADVKGDIYEFHPVSGKAFKGFRIPSWDRIREICLKAALVVEDMGFIGWDLAVRKDGGVALLEGNHGPSAAVMQVPFADSHIGLKPQILPYVDGIDWCLREREQDMEEKWQVKSKNA